MKKLTRLLVLVLVCALSLPSFAQSASASKKKDEKGQGKGFFIPLLTTAAGSLFNVLAENAIKRVKDKLSDEESADADDGDESSADDEKKDVAENTAPSQPAQANAQAAPVSSTQHCVSKDYPCIAYVILKIDPATQKPIQIFEAPRNTPPKFETGDMFFVMLETNMPGRIRLENVDPKGVVSVIDDYDTMQANKPTRLPVTGGYKLEGATGEEKINVYFTPCRPVETQSQQGVVEFKDTLPLCSTKHATALAQAGKNTKIPTRAITKVSSTVPSIGLGAVTSYSKKDMANGSPVKDEIKVIHNPKP